MRILFLGAPGAGKGTQCKRLSEKFALLHLSSGDILREAVRNGTKAGLAAKDFMDKGQLVPDPVLIDLFREKLSADECKKGFILDGFPRNLAQAESLDHLLGDINANLDHVIDLETSDDLLEERITGRRVCPNKACNAVYHVKFSKPAKDGICDKCGTELTHRSDDKPELVKQRLSIYHELTAPLIDFYKGKKILCEVSGEGEQEDIFANILKTLN
ncbi:MAG: adenylate kinase [Candidatus Obscuribacter sp.]|jgi:adenylate kinase|nr:adenylate kinase [Candidatus Obscuribacter sp.]MDQ5966766.1 adenylate kinase [Cyanobacteriota bacterium erpe_2018_sw_39hr_WHONDRS-SW48-000098_B_bin.30]MBK7837938.1 adenylate kinase [Candidatus Obscuribacter sp.]MBK9204782.1 adenylate kinase [Candidatus Obscuribacter sp.]MBK9772083.1 adenylate kinase [Candidatus Obscuribacter sp.]